MSAALCARVWHVFECIFVYLCLCDCLCFQVGNKSGFLAGIMRKYGATLQSAATPTATTATADNSQADSTTDTQQETKVSQHYTAATA
jgi:hypothetical protein